MKLVVTFIMFFSLATNAKLEIYTPSCILKLKENVMNNTILSRTCMLIVSCMMIDLEELKKLRVTISPECRLVDGNESKSCDIDNSSKELADIEIGLYVNQPIICKPKTCDQEAKDEDIIAKCIEETAPIVKAVFTDWYLNNSQYPDKFPKPAELSVDPIPAK